MLKSIKWLLLIIYLVALVAGTGLMVWPYSTVVVKLALVMLGVHLLEMMVMFTYVRRYKGGLAMSMLLTLLFGYLHWKPLMRKQQEQQ